MFDAPTEEQIEELKAEFGDDMRIVEYDEMTIVIALPADDAKVQAYYKRFAELMDNEKREEAYKSVFPALAVYPDKDTLKTLLKRRPGAVRAIGVECGRLLGVVPADAKKA